MGKKKRILIVEDEKPIAEYIETLLSLNGYETTICLDGKDAVKKARDLFPDLVLLDIMLPGLNGFDVCKILKEDPALQKTPVVMITSLNQMRDAEKGFEVGASDYVTKPFDAQRLVQKVKKHLGELPST